jgi:hypothetical protein
MKAGLLCLVMCLAIAPRAQAQMTWTDRGFANISGGYQAGSHDLGTQSTFTIYDETATVTTSQKVTGGGFFDISGGYKVWRNLAVGIGFSRMSSKSDAAINATIPDPVFFDRLRSVSTSANDLVHVEKAVNFVATWMMPVTDKIDVGFQFGPSAITVKQDLVDSLTVAEPGPTVTGVTFRNEDKVVAGINLGVDVTYMITKRYGVGGLARFITGSADLSGTTNKLTLGGFQIGAGGRVRF